MNAEDWRNSKLFNNKKELESWKTMLERGSGGGNKDEIKKNEHKIKKELRKVVDIKEELK